MHTLSYMSCKLFFEKKWPHIFVYAIIDIRIHMNHIYVYTHIHTHIHISLSMDIGRFHNF